jgi:hypothetical protein
MGILVESRITPACSDVVIKYHNAADYETLTGKGLRLLLPRTNLHGTQRIDEYTSSKLKRYSEILKKWGFQFLMDNPVRVCALPWQSGLLLAIIDGHHRARASGVPGFSSIPAEVYTPEQLVESIRDPFRSLFNADTLAKQIKGDVIEAHASFMNIPTDKRPRIIWGEYSADDIASTFPSLDSDC